jgi:RNA polymerase sigma-70 factor (ECF subfamily)
VDIDCRGANGFSNIDGGHLMARGGDAQHKASLLRVHTAPAPTELRFIEESGMCYSVAIPGILPVWSVGESKGGREGPYGRAYRCAPQTLERAHASMKTRKSTGAQPVDGTPCPGNGGVLDFGMLYEKFRGPIHSYMYRLLGSQEDADDLTQEVFTRAFIAWNDLYDRDNLSPWLYRIATNLCVDHLRRRKRISWWPLSRGRRGGAAGADGGGLADDEASYLPSNSGGIPEVSEREHIRHVLASMPRDYAIVLVLSAAQGVPYQEIAAIVGISPNAAATRISRAKRMFAEVYQHLSEAGEQE